MRTRQGTRRRMGLWSLLGVLALVAAGCGSSGSSGTSGTSGGASSGGLGTPPEQNASVLTSIGKGEGALNIVAWEGYAQPTWVKPFEKATGCQVNAKYAGPRREMGPLVAPG